MLRFGLVLLLLFAATAAEAAPRNGGAYTGTFTIVFQGQ